MRTYVTILAGPSAAESRPVVSSSHPEVVEAALEAMRRRATEDDPRLGDLDRLRDGAGDENSTGGEAG